jgi:peroxiredoxin
MTLSAHRGFSLPAAVLAALVMVGGCSNSSTGVAAGDRAPDFVLPRLDGTVQKLSNYRGQIVLVNFWATWCPPCIEEMPVLNRIVADYGSRGIVVLGLAGDDVVDRVKDFVAKEPLDFEVLHDPGGAVGTQYGITGYPETFLIDRDGTVISKIIGPLPAQGDRPSSELVAALDVAILKGN